MFRVWGHFGAAALQQGLGAEGQGAGGVGGRERLHPGVLTSDAPRVKGVGPLQPQQLAPGDEAQLVGRRYVLRVGHGQHQLGW